MAGNIYLVSYANHRMTIAQKKLEASFLGVPHRAGLTRWTMGFNEPDIDADFKIKFHAVLSQERGAGYWLWKPYIILKALGRVGDWDYILYSDAGIEIVEDISCLIELGKDIVVFSNEWPHVDFCKMDVLQEMLPGWEDRVYKQTQASAMLLRKTPETVGFVQEWLKWAQLPGFIDDTPSSVLNVETFVDHRHDQAILTNLCIKHNITRHWWPAIYNQGHRDLYGDPWPCLFSHHRKRNSEW
jgi:hypothetical protein